MDDETFHSLATPFPPVATSYGQFIKFTPLYGLLEHGNSSLYDIIQHLQPPPLKRCASPPLPPVPPVQVDNIKRAQNPIGMAISRIRTIERESGRPKVWSGVESEEFGCGMLN